METYGLRLHLRKQFLSKNRTNVGWKLPAPAERCVSAAE